MFYRILIALTMSWILGCSIDTRIERASKSKNTTSPVDSLSFNAPFNIQTISDGGVVTNTNHSQFSISGLCMHNGDLITINHGGSLLKTVTCGDGTWSSSLDLSSIADSMILIELVSGSFATSLSLPRKLSPLSFDILAQDNCVGNSSCMHPSNAANSYGDPSNYPILISCEAEKNVTLRSYGYDAGTWNLNTTELFNQSKICDRQGRALFHINIDAGSCYTEPMGGGGGCTQTKCRMNLKGNQNNQESDEEDLDINTSIVC